MTTALTCPRCGEPLAPGARYCTRCGTDVSGEQAALATVAMAASAPPDPQAELLERLKRATVGEFEVYGELGRGGMATVYLAHDIALGRKVAIKVMNPSLVGTGAQMVERFKREARTAAALSHPHIIPIYAVRETPFIFFVMKFVKGRSLDEIIKRIGPLPIPMFQTILHQSGGAIDYAHHQGTIHRDIKPANIMLDEDGWAVVTDFGIAKVADAQHLTMTGVTVGTPSYMSPEQCAAKEITAASDQYSLGIVAYEMLTGQVPFQADSVMGVMWQHFNDPPRPIRELRPDCPPEIEAAVLRMLGKKAEDRFASVEDAIDAIGTPTLRKDDPIRRQMKALAREGAGAEVLARVHTPASPLPTGGGSAVTAPPATPAPATPAPRPPATATPAPGARTPAPAAPAAPTTPVVPPPPRTPVPAPPVSEAPTVISDPHLAEAPTTITPAVPPRAAPPVPTPPRPVKATTPPPAIEPPRPAKPPRSMEEPPPRRSAVPLVAGVAVVALAGAGAWYFLAGPGAGSREPGAADSVAVTPPAPAPVASVRVSPSPTSTNVGGSVQLTVGLADAQGNVLTGRPVTWQASDTAVARVGPDGVVTARKAGTLTVTATSERRSGTATITVTETVTPVATVAVTPNPASVALGDSLPLVAAPQDARGTTLGGRAIQWSSSAPQVASVSEAGVVAALREGTATVTAVSEGRRTSVRVTVTPPAVAAVQVTPAEVTLPPGGRSQLTATARDRRGGTLAGRTITWTSSNEDVAAVSSAGRLIAGDAGRATITARIDNVTGTAIVIVSAPAAPVAAAIAALTVAPPPGLQVGGTAQLQAGIRDAQGRALDRPITWTSSNPAVATVSRTGQVTAVGPGSATITAAAEGRTTTVTVTVEAPRGAPPPVVPPLGGGTPPSAGAAAALPRRAIAAGGQHTCGITASGSVSCWGSNSALQLGDGGSGQQTERAGVLSAPRGATHLTAGGGHTCALIEGGTAVCWGQNRNGQLGGPGERQPVTVAGGRSYTAISAGARHTCAIAADGQLWCWGDNGVGQLGDGTTRGGATPRLVKGNLKFRAVAAGGDHTCAVTQAGKVHCWGDGFSGQLGRGIRETQSEPVEVSLPVVATAITAGAKHACALGQNGTVYCWGENRYGEVGDGSKTERATPVAVAGRVQFASVDAGNSHTCAVTAAGEGYCWGDNADGRLGDGTRVAKARPTKVSAGAVRSISAGGSHTCALTRGDEAVCWGGNARGQVGDGTAEVRAAPTPVTTR
ncbi:MAG TPA: Ig-like domain-containing protein [Gemmatimonadales bacterium]|nr:Ig-like domain-containing protein [Gemmatimonadales bacterium]